MKKITLAFFILFLVLSLFVSNYSNAEPRNVLLEFCTGTWCPSCPQGHVIAKQIIAAYPNTVVVSYHGGSSDPFANFNGSAVRSMLGFQYYPTGILDRTNHPGNGGNPYPNYSRSLWMGGVQGRYNTSPNTDINLSITSISYNPLTRELLVIVDATAQQNLNGVFKLQYVLTEDGLIYYQAGGGSNYVHDLVVRDMINGATGETISSGTWNQNLTITDTLSTTLNSAWVWDNCSLKLFVYKDSTGYLFYSEVQQATDTSLTTVTGVSKNIGNPVEYRLSQNYPNPFNPTTYIHFSITKDGNTSLKFYDVLGNEVAVYYDGFLKAGTYNAEFDGSDLSSGVYFYKLTSGDFLETKKMLLTK